MKSSGKFAPPRISSETGQAVFEQNNIEVPAFWSQLAAKVVASKYFFGDVETGRREHSVKQLIHRVCRMIADRGKADGYFASDDDAETFYNELVWLCVNQYGAFNSPVWFNAGLYDVYGVKGSRHNFHWDNRPAKGRPLQRQLRISPRPPPASFSRLSIRWKTLCAWLPARRCSSSTAPAQAPTFQHCEAAVKNFPAAENPQAL